MVISLIFLLLFCVYVMTNLYSYKYETYKGLGIITRTNKITGNRASKVITEDLNESNWTTLEDLKKEKEAKTKSEKNDRNNL